jgi:integrase
VVLLSEAELARLGDALRKAEERGANPLGVAALRLLLFLGARKSEVLELTWSEVDLEARCIRLGAERTKEKAGKTLPLPAAALEVLAKLTRLDSERVFPPVQRTSKRRGFNVEDLWRRIRADAGLPTLRIHDLRHVHASTGVNAGLSLPVIGKLLGHSRTATTERYSHLSADPLRAASDLPSTASRRRRW